MPYTVKIDPTVGTFEVVCETVEEVITLAREFAQPKQSVPTIPIKRGPGRPPNGRSGPEPKSSDFTAAIAMLRALKERKVCSGDAMVSVLEVKSKQGIGGSLATINRQLRLAGFEPGDVYVKVRKTTGERLWRRREKISDALEEMERRAEEQRIADRKGGSDL